MDVEAIRAHPQEAATKRDRLHTRLAPLKIRIEAGSVLGVWPTETPDGIEVHLTPTAFWRAVKRFGPPVTSAERRDLPFPHCHRFTCEGVEFFTFSVASVLPPGTVTPGFALRLT